MRLNRTARLSATADPSHALKLTGNLIALWTLAYLLPHLYWALGGRLGFSALHSSIAFLPQWRQINWIASAVMLAAAALGLAFTRPHRWATTRWSMLAIAWFGCSIGITHGLVGIAARIHTITGWPGRDQALRLEQWLLWDLLVFEPWFLIEGILFGLAGWHFAADRRARHRWIAACAVGIGIAGVMAVLRVKIG